jgi:hypothetical protein
LRHPMLQDCPNPRDKNCCMRGGRRATTRLLPTSRVGLLDRLKNPFLEPRVGLGSVP